MRNSSYNSGQMAKSGVDRRTFESGESITQAATAAAAGKKLEIKNTKQNKQGQAPLPFAMLCN